ncbi:MAG: hypothetical protein WDO71_11705 [Bacteroidota bacterium]
MEDVVKIDLKQNDLDIEKYITTLVKFANENEKKDAFSNSALFSESSFLIIPQDSLKKIIQATETLIANIEFREIIDKHIALQDLKRLVVELIKKFNETEEANLKKKWLTELIENIQGELRFRTNSTFPENIDLYSVITDYKKVEKLSKLSLILKLKKKLKS